MICAVERDRCAPRRAIIGHILKIGYWWCQGRSRAGYHSNQSLMKTASRRYLCCRVRQVCSKKSHHRSCTQDCHWWRQGRSRAGYHSNQSPMRNSSQPHLCCRVRPVCSKKSHHGSCTQDCIGVVKVGHVQVIIGINR